MSYIVVDVESDHPIPGIGSMICFGAVVVEPSLKHTFYGQTKPISKIYNPEALAISGFTRKEHEKFDDPQKVMDDFYSWVIQNSLGQPVFITDNPAYDFAWMNYYFHVYCGKNPFGYSARRIGDLYCGMMSDVKASWKHLRDTNHSHMPVDDAKGNAEALLKMQELGLKIKLI